MGGFNKILVANRGEIAVRVIRTARELGYRTVAVYSEADAGALHVQSADEAVCIGPAPVGESYLVSENVLEAARLSGASAEWSRRAEQPWASTACAYKPPPRA